MEAVCPECGSYAVKAVSRAFIYQDISDIDENGVWSLDIYTSSDVDFEGQDDDYITCMDCGHSTSQVYPEKWRKDG